MHNPTLPKERQAAGTTRVSYHARNTLRGPKTIDKQNYWSELSKNQRQNKVPQTQEPNALSTYVFFFLGRKADILFDVLFFFSNCYTECIIVVPH